VTASAFVAFERLAAGWTAIAGAVAWQSVVVVAAFAAVAAGLGRSSPALRCWLWRVAAIKLLLMPFWSVAVLAPAAAPRPPAAPAAASPPIGRPGDLEPSREVRPMGPVLGGATAGDPREPSPWRRLTWRSGLFSAWCVGVAGGVAVIVLQGRRLGRVLRRATPVSDARVLDLVADLAGRVGLGRPPRVVSADGVASPFVCRAFRPTLVLPSGLADALDADALRAVLVHELAHLKRRDLAWDWLPALAKLLYTVHPAGRYVAYRALLERELACDRLAMDLAGQDAAGYASTLVEVVSLSSPRRPAAPAASPNLED